MIKQYSPEWKNLLKQLKRSKNKSNRDVLCVKCWEVLTYERNIKHKLKYPDHSDLVVTSTRFATEITFINISKEFGKFNILNESVFFENPFKNIQSFKKTFNI